MLERLPVQRVQHGVPRAVADAGGAVGLPALAVAQRLPAQRALVDGAGGGAREGHAVALELDDGGDGLARHVVDRVLVAQPVGAFDRVVEVPAVGCLVRGLMLRFFSCDFVLLVRGWVGVFIFFGCRNGTAISLIRVGSLSIHPYVDVQTDR